MLVVTLVNMCKHVLCFSEKVVPFERRAGHPIVSTGNEVDTLKIGSRFVLNIFSYNLETSTRNFLLPVLTLTFQSIFFSE